MAKKIADEQSCETPSVKREAEIKYDALNKQYRKETNPARKAELYEQCKAALSEKYKKSNIKNQN